MDRIGRLAGRIIRAEMDAQEGHYVTLRKTPDGDLEMTATEQLRADADLFRGRPESDALSDMLEDHLGSGWEWVRPEEIGALTSGDIISDTVERDDEGGLTSVGHVYWDSMYQVQSTVETLLDEGRVVWKGVAGE